MVPPAIGSQYVNSVFLYKLNKRTGQYTALPTLTTTADSGFGQSVAFSKTGKVLAVGADDYDATSVRTDNTGALFVYGGTVRVRGVQRVPT